MSNLRSIAVVCRVLGTRVEGAPETPFPAGRARTPAEVQAGAVWPRRNRGYLKRPTHEAPPRTQGVGCSLMGRRVEGVPETPFPGDRARVPAEGQADAVWCGEVQMKQQKEPTPSAAPVGGRVECQGWQKRYKG